LGAFLLNTITKGDKMSHSVKVTIIADQEIELLGKVVNIHDILSISLDEHGKIIEFTSFDDNDGKEYNSDGHFTDHPA
jgi:hypothetical protein